MNPTAFDTHAAVKALREAGAEKRGQAEAIARAIETRLDLRVPLAGDEIERALRELVPVPGGELRARRRDKFMRMGRRGLA